MRKEIKIHNIDIKEAIQILKKHQEWRRDPNVPVKTKMQDPKEIGKAIDIAIIILKEYNKKNKKKDNKDKKQE